MPLRLSDLKKATRTISVKVGDAEFTVSYYPNKATPELMERVTQIERPFEDTCRILAEILADWDIVDENEDGEEYQVQPSYEMLRHGLAMEYTDKIFGAVFNDINPGEASGAISPDGSSPEANLVAVQVGTR